MSEDSWSVGKKVSVVSRLPSSPATDYVTPEISRVAVELRSDEGFDPSRGNDRKSVELLVNAPSGMTLSSGSSGRLDCGFSMKVPPGYRLNASSIIPGLFVTLEESRRVVATVFNAGEELVLRHRQTFARMWIEPVYFFEWR